MKSGEINSLFKNLSKVIKNPKSDLKYKNKFTLLVSVVLSAQCTDERVNRVTPDLFAIADNPKQMMDTAIEDIYSIIRPCGLAEQKSKNISALSKILVEEYSSEVPDNFISLENLLTKTKPSM